MPVPETRFRLAVVAAAVLFSTGGTIIKSVSLAGSQVACLRSGIAFATLALAQPSWRRAFGLRSLLVGVAYGATMLLFVLANKRTTAANTIFLQATAPLYLLLFGPLLLREKTRAANIGFTALLAVGMAMYFAGAEAPQATAPDPALGNLLGAAAGGTWALTLLGLRWLGREEAAGQNLVGSAILAGNLVACLATLPYAPSPFSVTPRDWVLVAFLGVFQIGLAYVFLSRAVRHVTALETSLLLLVEPVASALWAWVVHAETPGPWSLAGSTVILGATIGMAVWPRNPG